VATTTSISRVFEIPMEIAWHYLCEEYNKVQLKLKLVLKHDNKHGESKLNIL
jgi:hypothetical protein